jgi:hypothetical protein
MEKAVWHLLLGGPAHQPIRFTRNQSKKLKITHMIETNHDLVLRMPSSPQGARINCYA